MRDLVHKTTESIARSSRHPGRVLAPIDQEKSCVPFSSPKEECLNRMIFFGENSLRNAVREYLAHYHAERNHQGLENRLIDPGDEVGMIAGKIECRQRLGGMLRYYYRDAA